jgi:hypothetical protein
MPLDPAKRRQLTWTIVGAITAIALLTGVLMYVFRGPTIVDTEPAPGGPITSQTLKPIALEQTREWFGPWQLASADAAPQPVVVMLHGNGSLEISAWVTPVDATWLPDHTVNLNALELHGTSATLRTDNGQVFSVGVSQPFVFDTQPDRVYAVVPGTSQPDIVTTSAEWVHAHGHHL